MHDPSCMTLALIILEKITYNSTEVHATTVDTGKRIMSHFCFRGETKTLTKTSNADTDLDTDAKVTLKLKPIAHHYLNPIPNEDSLLKRKEFALKHDFSKRVEFAPFYKQPRISPFRSKFFSFREA